MEITKEDLDNVIRAAHSGANGRAIIDMILDLRLQLDK